MLLLKKMLIVIIVIKKPVGLGSKDNVPIKYWTVRCFDALYNTQMSIFFLDKYILKPGKWYNPRYVCV